MPCGKRCASATIFPLASRLTCQQSSMLTYTYPASFIPDFTTASAMPLIMSSLTLQANLFQEFQPIGGVSAILAEGDDFSCAERAATKMEIQNGTRIERVIFMQTLYQKLCLQWNRATTQQCHYNSLFKRRSLYRRSHVCVPSIMPRDCDLPSDYYSVRPDTRKDRDLRR